MMRDCARPRRLRPGIRWDVRVAGVATFLLLLASSPARACIGDVAVSANSPAGFTLFPNWRNALVSVMNMTFCNSTDCSWGFAGDLTGVTIYNYGTATGGATGDLSGLFFCIDCRSACTGPVQTMTYAGSWTIGAKSYPAWTWSGALLIDADPCQTGGGSTPCVPTTCVAVMYVYANVGSCPTDGATVALGPGYNDVLNPGLPGGFTDQYGCLAPWWPSQDSGIKTIRYANKVADRVNAAPGETITYRIYYGMPGNAVISQVTVMDTLPDYTRYVPGSGSPAPDVGWDPDSGPPVRLRWSLPGADPIATAGATREVSFSVTVNWGNDPFDMGSGAFDEAAPENERLGNRAQISWVNAPAGCNGALTSAAETVIRRFLFYRDADNDILFAPRLGLPADEITYSTFIQNVSATKTWWNVSAWDTVPASLDVWGPGGGFYDPCVGWTMTPTGCAPSSPGKLLTGPKGETTLLTWRFDLPPSQTLTLQWRAQVNSSAAGGDRAVTAISLEAYGFNGMDGTGPSRRRAWFTHVAKILLRTTYVSYTSLFGADAGNTKFPGPIVTFFPLNKMTDFAFYGLEYIQTTGPYSTFGGVSGSIGNFIGSCTGGFTGFSPGGTAGCKVERSPAMYRPAAWMGVDPDYPFHFVYKVVSNSPLLWQMLTGVLNDNQDHHFYIPTSSMSFRGFVGYTYRRAAIGGGAGLGDTLSLINVSTDPDDNYVSTLTTTAYVFKWNTVARVWEYVRSMDLGRESVGVIMGTTAAEEGFYRVLSSQSNLIVHQSFNTFDTLSASGCCDNFGTLVPTRETGNVVSAVGSGNFYLIMTPRDSPAAAAGWISAWVGNVGAADATYRIWRYVPRGTSAAPVPVTLAGTLGDWVYVQTDTVQAGLFPGNTAPPNPHVYNGPYDRSDFAGGSTSLFKVELAGGGPIQVSCGNFLPSVFAGGAVMNASDGSQCGQEFWYHQSGNQSYNCGGGADPAISALAVFDLFCPKAGMAAQCVSSDGYSSSYTTTGPDQVITFTKMTIINDGVSKRVWKLNILPNGYEGNVIALYNQCMSSEKSYTSAFLVMGTHYEIIAPPVVYSGQSFWITIVVVDETNVTKTDYCGTASFTSTDPNAKVEGTNMGSYVYPWTSDSPSCTSGSPSNNGVKIFVNVSLNALGIQSIIASDVNDGSITGYTTVMVVGVDVKLLKEPRLAVAASGDTVRFRVCWSNYSSASAANFVITDAVPVGTTYVPDAASDALCGATGAVSLTMAYSTSTSATMPAAFTTISPGPPPAGTRWLRWTIQMVGVRTTGCVCFRVAVD